MASRLLKFVLLTCATNLFVGCERPKAATATKKAFEDVPAKSTPTSQPRRARITGITASQSDGHPWGWSLMILSDGECTLEEYLGRSSPKRFRMNPAQIEKIHAAVRRAGFDELKTAYSSTPIPDHPAMRSIIVYTDSSNKCVTVRETPSADPVGRKEVKRFFRLWLTLCDMIGPIDVIGKQTSVREYVLHK